MRKKATRPEELAQFFVERANSGDVEGLVALYEPTAVLALPGGHVAVGHEAIRQAYQQFLSTQPKLLLGNQHPALRSDTLALTSTRLVDGGATAEVARQQSDGTWLWIIDRPNVLE